jgi:short-subunit dehydrogenase
MWSIIKLPFNKIFKIKNMGFSKKEQQRLLSKYGNWALVTGASSGIGKELATRLAEAGFNLFITARRQNLLNEMAENLTATYNVKVETITADVAQRAEIQKVMDEISSKDVGLLVASAGFGTSGEFANSNLDAELNMVQVNCSALLEFTYHFIQKFKQRGSGGIVLMSSIVAFQGVPFAANYAATKAYVQSLAEGLARELKPLSIDVLAAAPGPVQSGFSERANMEMDMSLTPQQVSEGTLKALGRKTTVFPGFLSKFITGLLATVPRWAKVRIMKMVMGGMTAHQRS